jgi:hypothetical protein
MLLIRCDESRSVLPPNFSDIWPITVFAGHGCVAMPIVLGRLGLEWGGCEMHIDRAMSAQCGRCAGRAVGHCGVLAGGGTHPEVMQTFIMYYVSGQ